MKGGHVKNYKRSPHRIRSISGDAWHFSELLFPMGVASQSGGSPRGFGVRFLNMHGGKGAHNVPWYSS